MLRYLIDGYNLLFTLFQDEEDFKNQRDWILTAFTENLQNAQIDAVLIFDAHYSNDLFKRSHRQGVEIVFTEQNQTADDYILEVLSYIKHPKNTVVVTSDKPLARQVKIKGALVLSVPLFLQRVQKLCLKKKQAEKPPPLKEESKPLKKTIKKRTARGKNVWDSGDFYLEQFEKLWEEEHGA